LWLFIKHRFVVISLHSRLNCGKHDILVNPADTIAISLANLDVTLVAVSGAQRSSDQIVASSCCIFAVPNNIDSKIDVGAAINAGNYTWLVSFESITIRINRSWEDLLGDSSLDRFSISIHVGLRLIVYYSTTRRVDAPTSDSIITWYVWVWSLSSDWSLGRIFPCLIVPTSWAAEVAIILGAWNYLLFREGIQGAIKDCAGALKCSAGRKSIVSCT
jgi:hypothetical protein